MHLDEFVAALEVVGRATPDGREFSILHPRATEDDPGARDPLTRDIVVAFNGPMAHVYVRRTGADGALYSWSDPPCQEDVDTIANGLVAALGGVQTAFGTSDDLYTDSADFFDREAQAFPLLALIDAIDVVLVRKGGDYVVRKPFPAPEVWPPEGTTMPLPSAPECAGKTVPPSSVEEFTLEQWFGNLLGTHPDAINRIRAMNHPERAGDIIIILKFRTDDLRQDRYSSGGNLPSWHGSLNRSDSYVPFIVSYPGGSKETVTPFVESQCGSATHCDSTLRVSPLIKDIISAQLESATEEQEQGP
jgi:hypothetical protein